MKTSEFDYSFPNELIAREPADQRDHSRLMVLERASGGITHKRFYDVLDHLRAGDLLVLNDTKVIPANLKGIKLDGSVKVEVLLVKPIDVAATFRSPGIYGGLKTSATSGPVQVWVCLVRPGRRLKVGSKVIFGDGRLMGKVLNILEDGEQVIEFHTRDDFWQVIEKIGEVPLPPYIKKVESSKLKVESRYQTIYASKNGASAAPTAGLHFTPKLLRKIEAKGVRITYLTLHTGLATFRPVWTENIEEHRMHSEHFEVPDETIKAVQEAERVIAVGTTVVRALESGRKSGETDLFIYPGYEFKVVDAIITNFHWPKSTLIMLVSAFAGKDFIMKAYREAIEQRYRLFSFGDAMLIL